MTRTAEPPTARSRSDEPFERINRGAAVVTCGIGAAVMAGWILDVAWLRGPIPGLIEMKVNTALGFILAGVSLWLVNESSPALRTVARACAGVVVLIGALSLAQYVLGRNLGIDELLFKDKPGAAMTVHPGRLAPQTALNFMLLGTALLLHLQRARRTLAEVLVLAATLLSLFAIIGYAYGVGRLSTVAAFSPMAVHTALACLAWSAGLLAARCRGGVVAALSGDRAGSVMARRMLPVAVVGLPLFGWLRLEGENAGLYRAEAGVAILVLGFLAMFAAGVLVTARALNRAEDERREAGLNEQRLAAIVQSSDDAIIGKRLDGTIVSWNPGAERLYGYSAEEALGRPISMLIPAGHEDELPTLLARVQAGNRVSDHETVRIAKDGTRIDVSLTISPVRDVDGEIVAAATVARDVTYRKRAEAALRASNQELESRVRGRTAELAEANAALAAEREFLNAVLDNLEDAVFACDADGALTLANRRARELYGLPDGPIEPEAWADWYSIYEADGETPMDPARVPLFRAFRGENVTGAEIVVAPRGRERRRALASGQPIVDADGNRRGAVVALHDVTERIEARREADELSARLEQAERLESVGQLAGGIAHDFNNLLAVILNYAAFVMEEMKEGDPVRDDVEEIRRAAERAAALTQQLLLFSRREIVKPEILDLDEVVAGTEKLLRRTLGEHVDLHVEPAGDLASVKADCRKLEQVLINLAVNARDAMPDGGRLTIETANVTLDQQYAWTHGKIPPGAYVRLAVTDTGEGMERKVMDRVFEPFFTTKPQGEGTGLGLATVYGIVKQAGGHVELYSEAGIGTVFKVYLPAVEEAKPSDIPSAGDAPAAGLGETILLAEDEPGVRELARRILARHGYSIVEAEDGEAALRAYAEHGGPIDLLLTDVVMPRKSGRELAEELGMLQPGLNVLYMSGYTEDFVVRQEVAERGVGLLEKPFSAEALLRGVRAALDRDMAGAGRSG